MKTRAEEDKNEAEKEIKRLKAEIVHIEDLWAKSSNKSFKNIMQQVHVICRDHDFSQVDLFHHVVNGRIVDMPEVNPSENNPNFANV